MRLIDSDSLKDYIDCGHLRPPTELCFSELDVCNMIDKRPTIDAVEVVRCRDCIHWFPHTQCGFDEDNDEYHDYCGLLIPDDDYYAYTRKPDDYCSYGECREDGEKE